jgi:endo-1,4-beta-D-glucanase Y
MPTRTINALVAIALATTAASAAINYSFPRNSSYAYGIKSTTATSAEVQTAYNYWLNNWYTESGSEARIQFDDKSSTVSEGIGYGMLIMVYMDNSTNNTQAKFDKLWAYYKNREDKYGLMNWKYSGFSNSASGEYAATDAEMDVALALLMAYKQWGNSSYLTDAQTLVANIWSNEVNSSLNLLKPGDAWDKYRNPSYFSTAAMHLFPNASSRDWSTVVTKSYAYLRANTSKANTSARLPSDWADSAGTGVPVNGNSGTWFYYDAVRTPWRMAVAYSWFGDTAADSIATNVAAFANSNSYSIKGDPGNVGDGYNLDGSVKSSYHVATYVGALGCAGMTNSAYQNWVNNSFAELHSCDSSSYYHATLKVLYELYMSGNFNNFWDNNSGIEGEHVATSSELSTRVIGHFLEIGTSVTHVNAELWNVAGHSEKNITASPVSGKFDMDISGMRPGVYVLRVRGEGLDASRRVQILGN